MFEECTPFFTNNKNNKNQKRLKFGIRLPVYGERITHLLTFTLKVRL